MRIGIDARALLAEQPTGVERMVFHFVDSLSRVAPPDHEFFLFADRPAGGRLPPRLPGPLLVRRPRAPALQRCADLWLALGMRSAIRSMRLDAFISLNTKFPLAGRACFTTVHGLEWAFFPSGYRRVERLKQWAWFQLCSRFSAGLITFSKHTHRDILRLRPRCAVPVCVVPEGVGPAFRRLPPAELAPAALERLGVRRPFVMSVCSHEPRKNLDTLIRAFARLRAERGIAHQLVLIGRAGWRSARLAELARACGAADHVALPGFVGDAELVQAYNQADAFVYPSLYEGFGLPLLEAMACGVPVVTSNATATAEVADGAALLVDPRSESELAAGIARCLGDAALRRTLVEAGLARARAASWDAMARAVCGFVAEHAPRARGAGA